MYSNAVAGWWKIITSTLLFYNPKSAISFKGKKFRVKRPAEPTDILWENLGGTGALRRRIVTNIVIVILLGICFAIIFASSMWKASLKSSTTKEQTWDEKATLSLLLMVPATIVSVLNILIS
jgi:hypothetical protein